MAATNVRPCTRQVSADIVEIYRLHRLGLASMCYSLVRDFAVAEDVVQETFARALAKGLDDSRSPWPWLTTVARNLCVDYLRERARLKDDEVLDFIEADSIGVAETALQRVRLAAARRQLVGAFSALSPRERRVIWLHDAEGWTYEEVAVKEGCSPGAARNVAFRARAQLRVQLRDLRNLGLVGLVWVHQRLSRQSAAVEVAGVGFVAVIAALGIVVSGMVAEPAFAGRDAVAAVVPAERPAMSALVSVRTGDVVRVDGHQDDPGPAAPEFVRSEVTVEQQQDAATPSKVDIVIELRDHNGTLLTRQATSYQCKNAFTKGGETGLVRALC